VGLSATRESYSTNFGHNKVNVQLRIHGISAWRYGCALVCLLCVPGWIVLGGPRGGRRFTKSGSGDFARIAGTPDGSFPLRD
jgi:hypothetical protein